MRAALVVVACTLCVSPAAHSPAAPPRPTFVGAIGSDGALTLIAAFDGAEWWNPWPWALENDEVKALPVPAALDAIPSDWLPPGTRLPREWKVLRRSGATARFRALRPVHATLDGLIDTFTLTTTFRPGPDEGEALAIAGPGVLGRFVTPARHETERVLGQLTSRLEVLERDEIDRWRREQEEGRTGPTSPLTRVYMTSGAAGYTYVTGRPADQRSDYGLTRASDRIDGKTYYYLGGGKLFKMKPGDDCMLNLSTDGLVVVDRRGAVSSETISSRAYSEFCGDAPESTTLLGTVRVGTRTLWVMRVNVEDGFEYLLFDPLLGHAVELKGTWAARAK